MELISAYPMVSLGYVFVMILSIYFAGKYLGEQALRNSFNSSRCYCAKSKILAQIFLTFCNQKYNKLSATHKNKGKPQVFLPGGRRTFILVSISFIILLSM